MNDDEKSGEANSSLPPETYGTNPKWKDTLTGITQIAGDNCIT